MIICSYCAVVLYNLESGRFWPGGFEFLVTEIENRKFKIRAFDSLCQMLNGQVKRCLKTSISKTTVMIP